jgi:murein DD-endopeptidase MepM/ murein hydrolase activator NlpD
MVLVSLVRPIAGVAGPTLAAAGAIAVLCCTCAASQSASAPRAPVVSLLHDAKPLGPCRPAALPAGARTDAMPFAAHDPQRTAAATYPLNIWPLERALHSGNFIVNYVDDDLAGGSIRDYEGGAISYDGHGGTDIAIEDFRMMDHGMRVLSGAVGTVVETHYSSFDRNFQPPFPDDGNYVIVENSGGSRTLYWHMRKNSLTVEPGENVAPGQILGMVGSSGYAYGPHLHFELGEYDAYGNWYARDPWHGANQPLPSLWISQLPYVGAPPAHIIDMGVTTQQAAGGDVFNVPLEMFFNRMTKPAILGANEPFVPVWVQFALPAGTTYAMEIRRPDNSLYASGSYSFPTYTTGWQFWAWYFSPYVPPSAYGLWTANVLLNGAVARRDTFRVAATTVYGPRFAPIDGRSFRIAGAAQKDTLRVSPFDPNVTYSLRNAPGFVSLRDSVVTIGATSTQASRSLYFQALATDALGRQDTMWYHIVDPTKPLDTPVAVEATSHRYENGVIVAPFARCTPNPARGGTVFLFTLRSAERVRLDVFDTSGRQVTMLVDEQLGRGEHAVPWNAEGLQGGVYWYRLQAGGVGGIGRVVVLP